MNQQLIANRASSQASPGTITGQTSCGMGWERNQAIVERFDKGPGFTVVGVERDFPAGKTARLAMEIVDQGQHSVPLRAGPADTEVGIDMGLVERAVAMGGQFQLGAEHDKGRDPQLFAQWVKRRIYAGAKLGLHAAEPFITTPRLTNLGVVNQPVRALDLRGHEPALSGNRPIEQRAMKIGSEKPVDDHVGRRFDQHLLMLQVANTGRNRFGFAQLRIWSRR
ncbi:MAG TPA: hypothetical protein VFP14_01515 [Novosphingobium sp.]|nr:hypothetical protein [Novosphingobium sp.]